MAKVFFVSGHMDLTEEEFAQHYRIRLLNAIQAGACFVVGDAPGCDLMAQQLFHERGVYPGRVRVHHMLEAPRCYVPVSLLQGGYASDEERDAAMTRASDEDIAWVRPGRSKKHSGTAKNLRRRREVELEQAEAAREQRKLVWDTWPAVTVSVNEAWPVYGFLLLPPEAAAARLEDARRTRDSCLAAGDPDPFAPGFPGGVPTQPVARLPRELLDRIDRLSQELAAAKGEALELLREQGHDHSDY